MTKTPGFPGVLGVAPTGVDPVTFRFSVDARPLMASRWRGRSLYSRDIRVPVDTLE
jgi:hypothetical protein